MSIGAYVGINGKAREITGGYVGVNGKARDITKAYVGIGGKARPFWSLEPIEYYGTIEVSTPRQYAAATTLGDYALFSDDVGAGILDVVDSSLTVLTRNFRLEGIGLPYTSATTIGNTAVFAGGGNGANVYRHAVIVNASMTAQLASNFLSNARTMGAAATLTKKDLSQVGVFAGGLYQQGTGPASSPSALIDLYNESLTRTNAGMSIPRALFAATALGSGVIIGGGYSYPFADETDLVDFINDSGTVSSNIEPLSNSVEMNAASSCNINVGLPFPRNAVFFGGWNVREDADTYAPPTIYNTSLSCSVIDIDPISVWQHGAAAVNGYSIFAGGTNESIFNGMDAFYFNHDSATFTHGAPLSQGLAMPAATAVGNYILFGGGNSPTIDVYKVM